MASEKVKMRVDERAIERSIEQSVKRSIKQLNKSYEEAEFQSLKRAEDRKRAEEQMGLCGTLKKKLLDTIRGCDFGHVILGSLMLPLSMLLFIGVIALAYSAVKLSAIPSDPQLKQMQISSFAALEKSRISISTKQEEILISISAKKDEMRMYHSILMAEATKSIGIIEAEASKSARLMEVSASLAIEQAKATDIQRLVSIPSESAMHVTQGPPMTSSENKNPSEIADIGP